MSYIIGSTDIETFKSLHEYLAVLNIKQRLLTDKCLNWRKLQANFLLFYQLEPGSVPQLWRRFEDPRFEVRQNIALGGQLVSQRRSINENGTCKRVSYQHV